MFKVLSKGLILSSALLVSVLAQANIPLLPAPPQIAAKSYILMDASTGEILVQKNIDDRLPPASLTKMMTAYIAEVEIKAGNMSLQDEMIVSEKAWRTGGSTMFLKVGDTVSIANVLRGIIIQSGNDASIAMAEHIAGDESVFAQLMNQYADKLGMKNSHFKNASGLPAQGHYSSAKDLAILARNIVNHDPELYKIYSEESFTYGVDPVTGEPIVQTNRNTLLRDDPSVDGLKTGYTDEARYCMVASAIKDDTRFIAVVINTSSPYARASESKKLLNYGFSFFESATLVSANEPLHTARVWKGKTDNIEIGLLEPINKTIQKNTRDLHDIQIQIDPTLQAPIAKGDVLGKLVITLEDEIVHEQVVVALNDVEQAGFFARLWDAISLFFFNLFN